MGLVAAFEAEQVGEVLENRVGHQLLGALVVDLDPLQVKEDQVLVDGGAAFLGEGDEAAVGGLVGLAGVEQVGVDGRVVHGLVDVLQLGDGVAEAGGIEAGDLAAVALLEGRGALGHRIQIRDDFRVVGVVVEDAEIPGHPVRAAGRRRGRGSHSCSLAGGRAVSVWLHYRRCTGGAELPGAVVAWRAGGGLGAVAVGGLVAGPARPDELLRLAVRSAGQDAPEVLRLGGWPFEDLDVGDGADGQGPTGAGVATEQSLDPDTFAVEPGHPGLVVVAEIAGNVSRGFVWIYGELRRTAPGELLH